VSLGSPYLKQLPRGATGERAPAKVLIVIPAYNEAANLPHVIGSLRQVAPDWDIAVVDDGSADGTGRVAQSLGVILLPLPFNLGIGGAVQTGIIYAARKGYDVCIQVDGDAQHDAEETCKLVDALLSSGADVVVGSRFLSEDATGFRSTFQRRIGIGVLRVVISKLGGQEVTDPTSGHRAFGRRAIEILSRYYPQQYPEPEVLHLLLHEGLRIMDVPVRMHARQHGTSSIRPFHSLLYMIKVLVAILVRVTLPRGTAQ
jgi:glycosyltransferase involved in cell wall biosynthesis